MMTEQEQIDSIVKRQIKLASAIYDKAMAYTNLIIVAGYAGFFGLWQITKDYLSPSKMIWAALFMSSSIFIFVVFEVVKNVYMHLGNNKRAKLIFNKELKRTVSDLKIALDKYEAEEERAAVSFNRFWIFTFIPTVVLGVLGFSVLVWAFISKLLDCVC